MKTTHRSLSVLFLISFIYLFLYSFIITPDSGQFALAQNIVKKSIQMDLNLIKERTFQVCWKSPYNFSRHFVVTWHVHRYDESKGEYERSLYAEDKKSVTLGPQEERCEEYWLGISRRGQYQVVVILTAEFPGSPWANLGYDSVEIELP